MDKKTQSAVNFLKKYVGKEIIRTKHASNGDWSWTDSPTLLKGFTSDGRIIGCHTGRDAKIFGSEEKIFDIEFTDKNWVSYKYALQPRDNPLNKWRGKRIKRIAPVMRLRADKSFMDIYDAPILISASKYHVIVKTEFGNMVLPADYAKPKDWVLV